MRTSATHVSRGASWKLLSESCPTHTYVMAHVCMGYVTHVNLSNALDQRGLWQLSSESRHKHIYAMTHTFLDGNYSTVQDLLVWFEVDLGFTKLWFIQTDLYVQCVSVFYSLSFSSFPYLDILRCFPRCLNQRGVWQLSSESRHKHIYAVTHT